MMADELLPFHENTKFSTSSEWLFSNGFQGLACPISSSILRKDELFPIKFYF